MRPDVKHEKGESVGDLIGEMGRERLALRCKTTLVVLLCVSASLCLVLAFASLTGYLPYAVGPAVALLVGCLGDRLRSLYPRSPISKVAVFHRSRR